MFFYFKSYFTFALLNKTNMKTFKNKNFTKRNYEGTNVVFCQAENAPNENWIECNEDEINCNQLWIENGVKYFGYL